MKKVYLLLILGVVLFTGCNEQGKLKVKDDYYKGYLAGCDSKKGFWDQNTKYNSENKYKLGWDNGYKTCDKGKISPLLKKGYKEGCSSKNGKYKKSEYHYNKGTQYKIGWDKGYSSCKETKILYERGYSHGKKSSLSKKIIRDQKLYKNEKEFEYKIGWDKGYSIHNTTTKNYTSKDWYNKGYTDGYNTSKIGNISKKERDLFKKNKNYESGWKTAYRDVKKDGNNNGYQDGYTSGLSGNIDRREKELFNHSEIYRERWKAGYVRGAETKAQNSARGEKSRN